MPIVGESRSWGPHNRNLLKVAHIHPGHVLGLQGTADALSTFPPEYRAALPEMVEAVATTPPSGRGPTKVTWLDGPAYVSYLGHDCVSHLYHFPLALMQLFAIARLNATTKGVPPMGTEGPEFNFTVGVPGLNLPPMDHLILPTLYKDVNATNLNSWTRFQFDAMTQTQTRTHWSMELSAKYSAEHWLCARGGVIIGEKPHIFTGPGDGHAWRSLAYAYAGLDTAPWPERAPPRITILDRDRFRKFLNMDAVVALAQATGLQVDVVSFGREVDFAQQVRILSRTGILLTAHGANMMHMMHLPPHAVAIEVYPYLGVVPIYARLADAMRVQHFAVYARRPSPEIIDEWKEKIEAVDLWDKPEYIQKCENSGLSSIEAVQIPTCDLGAKRSQIEVPLDDLEFTLKMAIDFIGCKAGKCVRQDGSVDPAAAKAKAEGAAR